MSNFINWTRRMPEFEPFSVITCPACGHAVRERMPTDACQFFYDCPGCGELLRPKAGDCCVYCSFGSVKCPPIQLGEDCCSVAQAQGKEHDND